VKKLIALLLCCGVGFLISCQQRTTVDDVVNMMTEARGGAEALAALTDYVGTWELTIHVMPPDMPEGVEGPMTMPMTWTAKRPNKIRWDVYGPEGSIVASRCYDGTTQRKDMTEAQLQVIESTAATFLDGFLNYQDKGFTLELLADEVVDKQNYMVLQVTDKHDNVKKHYINPETYFIERESGNADNFAGEWEPMVTTLNEYKMVDGIAWFHHGANHNATGEMISEFTVKEVEHNTGVDDAVFMADNCYPQDPFVVRFNDKCAVCHGENLLGTAQGTPLVENDLVHGDSIINIRESIAKGFPDKGMPAWSETLTASQIHNLSIYVREKRLGFKQGEIKLGMNLIIPQGDIESELHDFRLETVIDSLDPLPYSIAPLADGRILVTEKKRGLSIISREGKQSDLIKGTPPTYDDTITQGDGREDGLGWMMDVALHPDYERNGWIYIHHGDRCNDCNAISRSSQLPVSMNRLIRGRINDGTWVDEETLWQADIERYEPGSEAAAGGRISFDHRGHVFISVGMRGFKGIQDLNIPHGKIHRIYDDGRLPQDNPFVGVDGAISTIWTYGHRSPQGLEVDLQTGQLWGTEHGPRGGDEVNLLLPGRNYGWPLHSKGVNYDGTPVDYGPMLGIEFDLKDIEQPVVDLTPSPAISSLILYMGSAFPKWRNNIIVGSLKATNLYRMEIKDNKIVHTELLLNNLARIRDIETGPSGEIYLLLEHASGGQIVRLVP